MINQRRIVFLFCSLHRSNTTQIDGLDLRCLFLIFVIISKTANDMGIGNVYFFRLFSFIAFHTHFATISEIAVVWHVDRIKNLARNGIKLFWFQTDNRFRCHQSNRVRMALMIEDIFHR